MPKKIRLLFISLTAVIAILAIAGIIIFILEQRQPTIVNAQGEPIERAFIIAEDSYTFSDIKGSWDVTFSNEETVTINAQGYEPLVTSQSKGKIELVKKTEESVMFYIHDGSTSLEGAYIIPLDNNSYKLAGLHKTNIDGLAFFPEFSQDWTLFLIAKEGFELNWVYANITPENENNVIVKLTPEPLKTPVTFETPAAHRPSIINTAHAQANPPAPNVNLQINPPAPIVDVVALQIQISQLLAQIQQIQAQLTDNPSQQTTTAPNTNLIPSSANSLLNNLHTTALNNHLQGDSTGFFGPLTRSSFSKWKRGNQIIPVGGFYGTITRSKYDSLISISLPPPSSGYSDNSVTILTGRELTPDEDGYIEPIPTEGMLITPIDDGYEVEAYDQVLTIPGSEGSADIEIDLSEIKLYDGDEQIIDSNPRLNESPSVTLKDLEEFIETIINPAAEVETEIDTQPQQEPEPQEPQEPQPPQDPEPEPEPETPQEPIDYTFMCCYDPTYPEAPYFLPFAGDDCSVIPGGYEVNLSQEECANDFIID
jgi:hypothetical protein